MSRRFGAEGGSHVFKENGQAPAKFSPAASPAVKRGRRLDELRMTTGAGCARLTRAGMRTAFRWAFSSWDGRGGFIGSRLSACPPLPSARAPRASERVQNKTVVNVLVCRLSRPAAFMPHHPPGTGSERLAGQLIGFLQSNLSHSGG